MAPEIRVREGAIAHPVKGRRVGRIILVKDVLVHLEPAPGTGVRVIPE